MRHDGRSTDTSRRFGPATVLAALIFWLDTTYALEGRVVDARNGEPLANVTVSVLGGTQTARSNAEGRFFLVPDPRPPFDVLMVLTEGVYVKPVRVDALPTEGPLLLRLAPSMTELVTVTAGAAPAIRAAPAAGTTVLTRGDIQSREPRNLTQSLENVPGVSNVSEGHASVPAIRGLAQARTLLLIDGARVTAERRIGPSATFVDPFVLEGIEVARGPGSVAYGSDALGGVIMARTRRPRPGADFSLGVAGAAGTGVPEQRIGVEVESGLGDSSALLLSVHRRDFNDYDSPGGEVPNSGSRDTGFLASYAELVPGGLLTAALQGDYGRDIGRPRTNSDVVRFYYPTEDSLRLTTAFESGPLLGFDSTSLSLFIGDYDVVTDQDTFAKAETNRRIARADVTAHDFALRGDATSHWAQTEVVFGVDLNGRFDLHAEDVTIDFDASGAQTQESSFTTIEDAQRIDAGVYCSAEGAIGPVVTLAGGLRYDRVRTTNVDGYFGDRSVINAEPSGYAGVTFGPFSGFSTTLQYARGFRDARLSDRFFRGVTGAGYITGNPDLEAETSDQYDIVLRWGTKRWRTAIYAYHYDIENLIERYEGPLQPDYFYFRNRGRARIRGLECELLADLPKEVSLLISGSVSEGEALDDGIPLDDIAPGNLVVQARKGLKGRGWVQVRGAWADDLDEPGPNEVALDSHSLVDVSAGWMVAPKFELQLLVRNLFDESYLLTPDRRSPWAPGLSAMLSARWRY